MALSRLENILTISDVDILHYKISYECHANDSYIIVTCDFIIKIMGYGTLCLVAKENDVAPNDME